MNVVSSKEPKIITNRLWSVGAFVVIPGLFALKVRDLYRPWPLHAEWRIFFFGFLPGWLLNVVNLFAYGWWLYAVASMMLELKRSDERMLMGTLTGLILLRPIALISPVERYIHLGIMGCALLAAISLLLYNWNRKDVEVAEAETKSD